VRPGFFVTLAGNGALVDWNPTSAKREMQDTHLPAEGALGSLLCSGFRPAKLREGIRSASPPLTLLLSGFGAALAQLEMGVKRQVVAQLLLV
jgi:hypothetical protein